MNSKSKLMALISLILVMCSGASANNWISHNKPLVEVAESNWDTIEIEVVIDGFQNRDLKTKGGIFTQLSLDDNAFKGEEGEPRLPVIRKLVEVPYGADVTLDYQIESIKTIDLGAYQLIPVQPPIPKLPGALEAAEFKMDSRVYRQNRFLSEPEVRIQDIDYMRGHRLVVLEISPVSYNPGHNLVQYSARMSIRLNLQDADQELTAMKDYRYYSAPFEMFFEANVINHGSYRDRSFTFPPPASVGYMILNIAAYTEAIQPLVEWKTVQGYDVTVVDVPSGATTTTIKALIQNAYDNWLNPPSYVLLNGDTDTLPAYSGESSGSADDNQYTELEGVGFYTPDVMIGRFSVRSVTDVQNILTKSLQWDMTSMPDTSYLKDSLFLASSDHGSMLEGTHEWSWNNHIKPYDQLRNIYHPVYERQGGNTTHFAANVNEGRSLVNYSGHGYGDGSGTACIKFVHSDVQALTNANKYPHVMVFACGTNLHNQTISFGERWLLEANKGSVSFWGTSDSSYWDEDDDLERAIYQTQNQDYQYSLSAMYFSGLYKIYQAGYSSAAYYYDIYNLMGDPSLPIHGRIPMVPVIDAPVNTTPNPQTFTVTIFDDNGPAKYALVAIHDGVELLGSAFTDETGEAAIYIDPSSPGTAVITVSGRNLETTQQELQIMAAGCGYVVMDRALYNCDHQINIALWDVDLNVNPGVVDTATVTISSDTTPAGKTVVLTETGPDTSEFRGSILTSSTQSGSGYLRVSHGDQITLHYYDDDCEGSPVDVYDYAEVDCISPMISNVTVEEVSIDSFKVSWTTDKPTNTVLNWGDSIPLTNQETAPVLTTDHSVTVKDLDDCTLYYFTVAGTDAAGNTALDDNHGSYYTVITYELVVMLEANMDTDPGWTYEGEWAWGQPAGQGGQYGSPDPTSGHTGLNAVGYNLNGDYPNSMSTTYWTTTQAFDCSDASEVYLDFYAWLGVETYYYDHAYLAISNNNGGSWSVIWENPGRMDGGSWEPWNFDISDKAAGYSQVKLRWGMGPTDSSWRFCGWNIDDVVVSYTRECTSIPTPTPKPDCLNTGDVNNDGELSAEDAQLAFQIAIGAFAPTHDEECAADCSGDGIVSSTDAQYIFLASLGSESCVDPLPTRWASSRLLNSNLNRLNRIDGYAWVQNTSGMAGETLTIPIKIQNTGTEIDAFTLKVEFDSQYLILLDVMSSALDPGWVDFGWNQVDEGSAIIAAYSIGLSDQDRIPSGKEGVLVEMIFLLNTDVEDTGIVLTNLNDDLKNFALL